MAAPKKAPVKKTATKPPMQSVQASIKNPGRIYNIIGLICAVISILIVPILFGPAAIILGIIGFVKGDKILGIITITLGFVFMIIGFIIGMIVYLALSSVSGSDLMGQAIGGLA